ncbi:uncharacterized protein LOC132301059 [Cornus florida]|uniref:uncharacterized protein LOC132301059 n=1 Tax=Cornus florida TaxID=4283 RepID=UPI0028A1B41B|nr:uncharacterized protein LOC132301059 [Cornus florida]
MVSEQNDHGCESHFSFVVVGNSLFTVVGSAASFVVIRSEACSSSSLLSSLSPAAPLWLSASSPTFAVSICKFASAALYTGVCEGVKKKTLVWLHGRGLGNHLTKDKPKETDTSFDAWEKEDAQIISLLLNSNITRVYELCKQYFHLEQGNHSIEAYYSTVMGVCEELNMYQPITADVRGMQQQREDFNVVRFLTGLLSTYEPFRAQIMGSPTLPSLAEVFSRLQRATLASDNSNLNSGQSGESSAWVVSKGEHNAYRGGRGGRSTHGGRDSWGGCGRGRESRKCTHCGLSNHTVNFCWDLHDKPSGYANQVSSSTNDVASRSHNVSESETVPVPRDEYNQFLSYKQASNLSSTATFSQSGNAHTCLLSSIRSPWIDTGASDHMTGCSSRLSDFNSVPSSESVTFANGSSTQDLKTKKKIGTGHEAGGLYYFDLEPYPMALQSSLSPFQRHYRLSHLSLQVLKRQVPSLSHLKFLSCEVCQLKRKNRPLLEVTRALLFHMRMPKRFWGGAVLTACHLINRMPSSVLDGKSPYSILFPDSPLFSLPLRVFGCVCYVHNLGPGFDKLDPRATNCVSLGYSRSYKGYCCYGPVSQRYFISADVTFCESIPYFSDNDSLLDITPESPLPAVPLPSLSLQPSSPSPALFQVYKRRPKPSAVVPPSSSSESLDPTNSTVSDSLPIALRKAPCSCVTNHPIAHYVSYNSLSPLFSCFSSKLSITFVPKTVHDALFDLGWRKAIQDEMDALHKNGTWTLVPLPPGAKPVGCR